jgi:diadenosine tetraphosphatase ApaH/serine/threonine PP2A family protein phosphatase
MILLLALKCAYPLNITLLRGNHESRQMTLHFNFREECLKKYDQEVYELMLDCFMNMPLAALLAGKFLLVHAGIPYNSDYLEEIAGIRRKQEIPFYGPMCDLLWSDPS